MEKNTLDKETEHFREETSDFRRGTSGTREIHCKPHTVRVEFIPFVGTNRRANRKSALKNAARSKAVITYI